MKVLAISGSLRRDSYNTTLLRAAKEVASEEVEVELFDGLKDIPAFDEDDERGEAPTAVARLRDAIEAADAVLFATPEYNGSIPGQLKNALDWASRPFATNPLRNKPVTVVGASTGGFGAMWAQADLRRVLKTIGARVIGDEVPVPAVHTRTDEAGRLADAETEERLREVLDALGEAVEARQIAA
jgi:chromate reductase